MKVTAQLVTKDGQIVHEAKIDQESPGIPQVIVWHEMVFQTSFKYGDNTRQTYTEMIALFLP